MFFGILAQQNVRIVSAEEIREIQESRVEDSIIYFGKRLEPRGQKILHGVGQHPTAFQNYYDTIGPNKPVLFMTYRYLHNHQNQFLGLKKKLESYPAYIIPQIGVSFHKTQEKLSTEPGKEIIREFILSLEKLNRPSFIRLGFEFNGEWNKYDPEMFRKVWIQFARELRSNPILKDKTALVWCYAPEGSYLDKDLYYPGDQWVDWWGLDLFSPEHFFSKDANDFAKEALEKKFPVMIGETSPRWIGVTEGKRSWSGWYRWFFKYMERHQAVKAFSYITYDWAEYHSEGGFLHDWGDARVWKDSLIFKRWKNKLRDSKYIHATDSATVFQALGLEQ